MTSRLASSGAAVALNSARSLETQDAGGSPRRQAGGHRDNGAHGIPKGSGILHSDSSLKHLFSESAAASKRLAPPAGPSLRLSKAATKVKLLKLEQLNSLPAGAVAADLEECLDILGLARDAAGGVGLDEFIAIVRLLQGGAGGGQLAAYGVDAPYSTDTFSSFGLRESSHIFDDQLYSKDSYSLISWPSLSLRNAGADNGKAAKQKAPSVHFSVNMRRLASPKGLQFDWKSVASHARTVAGAQATLLALGEQPFVRPNEMDLQASKSMGWSTARAAYGSTSAGSAATVAYEAMLEEERRMRLSATDLVNELGQKKFHIRDPREAPAAAKQALKTGSTVSEFANPAASVFSTFTAETKSQQLSSHFSQQPSPQRSQDRHETSIISSLMYSVCSSSSGGPSFDEESPMLAPGADIAQMSRSLGRSNDGGISSTEAISKLARHMRAGVV
eukprot:TRINITY_DN36312_c0_g2_i1.p1 TRINITY_DN36312_c0_g2~~TRINITY_DN36312_c0_g2_i1.p1  ORF type:complete len:447 (+),score=110.85 TRINITY_DN36312_c0_g2_i1:112-1452(+)